VANVLDQPSELRFRRLRRSNSTLAKVLPIPGVEQLLHAVGFEETSTNEHEPVLFLSAASIDEALLRQALSGLDQLIEAFPPALAPAARVAAPGVLNQTEAGTPVTLRGWDSRFRRPACVGTVPPMAYAFSQKQRDSAPFHCLLTVFVLRSGIFGGRRHQ